MYSPRCFRLNCAPFSVGIIDLASDTTLWSLALYIALVIGLCVVMIGLSWMLGERTPYTKATLDPYESGITHVGSARYRFDAKYYLMAMFFVIFDLEAVFVYVWAVSARESGWAGYIEMLVFLGILVAALSYLWRLGALEWAPKPRRLPPNRVPAKA
jgi:NADH-quinone oxidoreductase subunit A